MQLLSVVSSKMSRVESSKACAMISRSCLNDNSVTHTLLQWSLQIFYGAVAKIAYAYATAKSLMGHFDAYSASNRFKLLTQQYQGHMATHYSLRTPLLDLGVSIICPPDQFWCERSHQTRPRWESKCGRDFGCSRL